MDKIVTFIIPAYNADCYLAKCLESFLCPSVYGQIEILIVDDGSNDNTGSIADQFAKQFPAVFHVIHKKNGGHGSVINIGSQFAAGKYFKVIDADDWVITQNLPRFISELSKCDADIILTPFCMVDMKTGLTTDHALEIGTEKSSLDLQEIAENPDIYGSCCVFHSISYRTDFYLEHYHHLPEHVFYDDQVYNAIPFCNAKKLVYIPIYLYQYMVGNDQQSIAFHVQANRIGHLRTVVGDLVDYYHHSNQLPSYAKKFLLSKIRSVILIYYATAFIYEKDRKKGRNLGIEFNRELFPLLPDIYHKVQKHFMIYRILNRLHTPPVIYQKLIHSTRYKKIKQRYKTFRI